MTDRENGKRMRWRTAALVIVVGTYTAACASNASNNGANAQQGVRLSHSHFVSDIDLNLYKPPPPDTVIALELNFAMQHKDQFDQLMKANAGNNSDERPFLTPAEMHGRFGVTQEQFNAVAQWIEAQGFTITDKSYGGNEDYIRFKGTLVQVEQTFDVHIVLFEPDRFRNAKDPEIPPQFAGVIETITGFSGLMPM